MEHYIALSSVNKQLNVKCTPVLNLVQVVYHKHHEYKSAYSFYFMF